MNLLVDIGNSRIKWSGQTAGGLDGLRAAQYSKANVYECLDAHWKTLAKPQAVWLANVAGKAVAEQLARWTVTHWNLEPQFAQVSRTAGEVRNGYADSNQLGIDRWLALIATWQKYKTAACIVDCGTAVTIDGLDATGRHLGGLILPGVPMMQQALSQTAAGIPVIDTAQVVKGLAVNTGQGVINGCTMAVVTLIEHTVDMLRTAVTGKLNCVITGGGAGNILPLLKSGFMHEPQLVLEGLGIVADNKS